MAGQILLAVSQTAQMILPDSQAPHDLPLQSRAEASQSGKRMLAYLCRGLPTLAGDCITMLTFAGLLGRSHWSQSMVCAKNRQNLFFLAASRDWS